MNVSRPRIKVGAQNGNEDFLRPDTFSDEEEERFIAQKPRDAEEYLDYAGRRVRGTNAEEKLGLLRSE